MVRRIRQVWLPIAMAIVSANSIYLVAYSDPSFLRVASGLLHLVVGSLAVLLLLLAIRKDRRSANRWSIMALSAAVIATVTAALLIVFGNLSPQRPALIIHSVSGGVAVAASLIWIRLRAFYKIHRYVASIAIAIVSLCAIAGASYVAFRAPEWETITNPILPPANMAEEAFGGESGMFFPSSAYSADADTIPGSFFSRSESCGRSGCHPDIVDQWKASAHRFSSFNNQWYRKSIEYLQEVAGNEAPKWCAGCHDHALLFSGQMAQPVDQLLKLPEAHAGTGCMSCHSVRSVTGTMGNGGIEIAYPLLHELSTSDNRLVQMVHDFALRIDPEPHRRAFLKPMHRRQTSEFCSSCHKVHLDKPLNDYRWVRGFNTYDSWQASGVSGHGTRSFYEPDVPLDCGSCHMPYVASDDAGNDGGFVHNHRFIAANTALPTANEDSVHLQATVDFLSAGKLSVDIFAVSSASASATGDPIIAPLHPGLTALTRGTSVKIDVVVRSLAVGHVFPTGTVDAQEAWLEFKVLDEDDNILFWSGPVADEGRGKVDEGAHFYRSVLVDEHANPINKRNAWAARSTVYANLIPPGSADVAHFRFQVPSKSTASLRLIAALQYRKFDWWHNQYAYAGEPDTGSVEAGFSIGYDDRAWRLTGSTADVSGRMKSVPVLPIVTMATDTVRLRTGSALDSGSLVNQESDWVRWNDYGIGLMRQGDLGGAARAFGMVVELDPEYADGWVNLARVHLQEGDFDLAAGAIAEALGADPGFTKALYFRALIHKAVGEYDAAISVLETVVERFPKDRVVIGELGRVLFLNDKLQEARLAFEDVLRIDPEDVASHYNLMLIHRASGRDELAIKHQRRYDRFKSDESAPAISRAYRLRVPADNNEALSIHEHVSSPWPFAREP